MSTDKSYAKFLDAYWRKHNCSPSYSEIMQATGIRSSSMVRDVVERVAEQRGDKVVLSNRRVKAIVPGWVRDAISRARSGAPA